MRPVTFRKRLWWVRPAAFTIAAVLHSALASAQAETVGSGSNLALGILLVERGEFGEAIPILERAAQGLKGDLARSRDLARAYRYIGIAHLGLGEEMLGRAKSLEGMGRGTIQGAEAPSPVTRGVLQIAVHPWAEVSVDGVAVGLTPLSRLRVGSGTHLIRCEHPGFEPLEREVAVQARELTRLVVDLTSEAIRRRP